jgi:predicted metal-dependent hydrolase
MATLTVRRLLVDLSKGFPRHWHGGDAFKTAYFNALSMSFPTGEQFFIDAVREAAQNLPDTPEHAALRDNLAGFTGQESNHRQVHALYNAELERQGLVNHWERRSQQRLEAARGINPLHNLAVTCAFEHCTAVFAHLVLTRPDLTEGAHPPMAALWRWHSVEEIEHKSVAFDLYRALGGNEPWRRHWYRYALTTFTADCVRQTVHNLWRDGTLFKAGTWVSAARFLLGRRGMVWACIGPLRAYFRTDFHPWQHDNRALATQWLAAHEAMLRVMTR